MDEMSDRDEIAEFRARYSRLIEDGRKVEVFTSIPEWQWYADSVIKPTIEEYTNRIMTGKLASDKEDWIMRGIVMGLKLLVETTESFKHQADEAQKEATKMEEHIKNDS